MEEEILFGYNRPLSGSIPAWHEKLKKKIENFGREYILDVSETDLRDALVKNYKLDPPVIKESEMEIAKDGEFEKPITEGGWQMKIKGNYIELAIPFKGDGNLFRYRGDCGRGAPTAIIAGHELRHVIDITRMSPENIQIKCGSYFEDIRYNLGAVQNMAQKYNEELPKLIASCISQRKQKLLNDLKILEAVGIPIRRRSDSASTLPLPDFRRKPGIILPTVKPRKYESEWILPASEYDYILQIIKNMVLVMERSPRSFIRLKEENLRDFILVILNAQYEGMATGETFNYSGKTDILIRYEGKNVFIAECKFWSGEKDYIKALDQLLDYVSWRDTKVAVIIFNRNKDLTNVLKKISEATLTHSCFKRELGKGGETHFKYLFHQPNDRNREMYLAVLVFDVPTSVSSP